VLSIGKIAVGQHRYYEQQVAQGVDDYYAGRGEAQGEWVGAGARELGLSGPVTSRQFNALIAGSHPGQPEMRLRASPLDPKIAALDLTFSAPKSVSVLFAVAPAEVSAALIACHEEAVRAALGYLEDTAVMVRRGHAGEVHEPGVGFLAAAYRHRMSRALDPQLHTHVVAANLTRGPDGRYTALHAAPLYRAAQTAGYLYQAHLRTAVRERLGLEWGPVHKGAAELRELPVEVLRTFSQRRAQVVAAVAVKEAELGRPLTKAERATWGAIATRDRKQYGVDTHTWREEITARAAEHGLDRDMVDQIADRGQARLERGEVVGEGELEQAGERVGEAELANLLAGPAGLTERANTFDEPAVLREFAAASVQGARVATVRGLGRRFAAREDVLATTRGTLTSADLVEHERALIEHASGRSGGGVAQLDASTVAAAIAAGDRPLNEGQADAVRAVATSGNGVDVIEALAGTGKTYTAGVLRELYERAGNTVFGVAPSGRAARELTEQAGIASRTLDSLLLAIDGGRPLPERSVLIIDEAGMASTRLSERLLAHAAAVGAKVIVIGDPGQLPSVHAGGWLRAISDRLGSARLTEVMRQRDPQERLALAGLHDGNPRRWIEWATQAGRVDVVTDGRDALEQAVVEWAGGVDAHGVQESVLIARNNDTRNALNELAREQRRGAGALGDERNYGAVTVAVSDRVICRNNDRDLDVDNGTRGTVRHVDAGGIVIETDARLVRELPAGYVAEHVEHAYALTGHGMQGGTVEQATVLAGPHELSRSWSYTALSRARGQTRLLVHDTTDRAPERDDLAPSVHAEQADPNAVLARVGRKMLERDDEDLAVDQLPTPGRADDPQLIQTPTVGPPQENAAERAEPPLWPVPRPSLTEMREQLERLRAQLQALPSRELTELDELDARTRTLTERRDLLRSELDRLPAPRERRFGRGEDPHRVDRTRIGAALAGAEDQLERTLTQRATLARQVGDIAAIRDERDALTNATTRIQREHTELRNELAERDVAERPAWTHEALGERPERPSDARRWDNAARTIARYRIEYAIPDSGGPLGPQPADREQRADYQGAQRAREQLARELGHETPGHQLDIS
jgi:conjugative relaxase-like TrwC/TraI family protein